MRRWTGPIVFEGEETGDDRNLLPGSLSWETPFALNLTHLEDAPTVGSIDSLERRDDGSIWGTGTFLDTEEGLSAQRGCEAAQAAGMAWGVSVDLDSVSMDYRVRPEVLQEMGILPSDEEEESIGEEPVDEAGRITIASFNQGDFMTVIKKARIRAASLVSIPAFHKAYVQVMDEVAQEPALTVKELPLSLVAAAFPVLPPSSWFENPNFTSEYPISIADDGYICGHAAPWGTFHIGFGGQRVEAPRTQADYAYFRTGVIRTAEGTDVAIGVITMDTGHASDDLGSSATMAHYDDTGTVVADVVCGEDDFGIWVAGAMRPSVTDEQVRALRAAPLSGDWREIRGNLELVALLAVNTPGFMVPRMSAMVASGEVRSLVASAVFGAPDPVEDTIELSREEKIAIRELVARNTSKMESQIGVDASQCIETASADAPEDIIPDENSNESLPDVESPGIESDTSDGAVEETAAGKGDLKPERAEAARKSFRAEKARLRALKAKA